MAEESFSYGMTAAQVSRRRRRYKTDPHFPDTDNYGPDLDYEREIANASDGISDSSRNRLRRIVITAIWMAAALLAIGFLAPFLQH